jgi:hypothetical protein
VKLGGKSHLYTCRGEDEIVNLESILELGSYKFRHVGRHAQHMSMKLMCSCIARQINRSRKLLQHEFRIYT